MRLRRLSAIFWTTCIIAVVFILYVMTDLSFKLPSIKPAMQELDDSKWSSFESKLRNIEMELNQHHAVVGEIRSAVDQIVDKSQNEHLQNTVKQKKYKVVESIPISKVKKYEPKTREYKVVGDEPPKMHQKLNMSMCAIQKDKIPKTDVQMLDLYETTMFEDTDGGAWKQGWSIEFNARQWSQKNKLKVFIVPHSHNDPGWLMTFENYYRTQTKTIFKNIVEKMTEGAERKFIWAETCYLALWWTNDATETEKAAFKNLLDKGQLEIVTGGWVMNDEANSHWLSVVQQLTTGHQWLIDNLGYTPKNAWSIDPFGYSSSQPYLLKLAGFDNSVIQRVHYIVKKELARNRQLEFKWRQLWDGTGKTDMFTHLFPFYSYDVPHSCGPDPKICCQFDFKRLPGHGVTCPWGIAPRKIVTKNVQERASVILDQWRKKAQLYKSNVVLFPLGDDFRYDNANEWDNQFGNYDLLIDYINNKEEWNAEVHFGTLTDYFKALHEEVKMADFPSLSGDFFTYADRNNHYWSGYFTSRPFYKNMDRVLLSYVRAAEIATAQATLSPGTPAVLALQLRDRSEQARRALALFQHHDGVTGTARNDVVVDYAKKMHTAIKYCQSAIQQAAYFLLKRPAIQDQTQEDVFFEVDDVWRRHDEVPSRITIVLDALAPARRLVLHNGLTVSRLEVITLFVSSPHVEVFDPQGSPVSAQVSPAAQGERRLGFAPNKFQLSFVASVGALGLSVYTVSLRDAMAINKYTSFSRVRVYNANYWTVDLPKMFQVEQPSEHLVDTFNVRVGNGTAITADYNGLLRSIRTKTGTEVPVNMQFVQYDTLHRSDNNSGAYLFIPSGPAQQFKPDAYPEIVVVEGPLKSTVYTSLVGPKTAEIMVAISLYENPSLPHPEVEITNTLLIDPAVDDVEIAMRFDTEIKNGDAFYTDLNGMQMIRRKRFSKLPLQANFYPLPAAAYLQDETARLSLLTATPLGVAALQSGQIEVMQDRRLSRDDNRGMNQGVMDNVRTRHTFKLIYETATQCQNPPAPEHPSGQLTLGAHVSQQFLLQPLLPMQYTARDAAARPTFAGADSIGADIVLASFNAHVSAKNKQQKIVQGIGLTFQRVYLETCYGSHDDIAQYYPVSDGVISLGDIIGMKPNDVYDSTLTFSRIRGLVPDATVTLCPNEIRSVFLQTMKNG